MTTPTPAVDLLRRAAERLRDPLRCNTDPVVDRAVADWLHRVAVDQEVLEETGDRAAFLADALAVAGAVLAEDVARHRDRVADLDARLALLDGTDD